jgi:hypothetical protein
MAGRRKSVWRVVTAFAAAFLLVLQMIVGSLALAAEIAPARDALGSIICISHPDQSGPSDQNGGSKVPACCMFGCNLSSPGLLAAHADDPLENRLEAASEPLGIESDAGPFYRPETHPGNPRAPPLLG